MHRLSILLLYLFCASCVDHPTMDDPDHGYFRAFPTLSNADYSVEVDRFDAGDVIVLTVFPRIGDTQPSTVVRRVPRNVEQSAMSALVDMAKKQDSTLCIDGTTYLVAISKGRDSSSRVSDSCTPAAQKAAASLYHILQPLFPSLIPTQENWAHPPKTP